MLFATNDKQEAVQAAKDFGQGTVVVSVDEKGSKQRIYTASYDVELAVKE